MWPLQIYLEYFIIITHLCNNSYMVTNIVTSCIISLFLWRLIISQRHVYVPLWRHLYHFCDVLLYHNSMCMYHCDVICSPYGEYHASYVTSLYMSLLCDVIFIPHFRGVIHIIMSLFIWQHIYVPLHNISLEQFSTT